MRRRRTSQNPGNRKSRPPTSEEIEALIAEMDAADSELHRIVDDTANYDHLPNATAASRPLSDSELAYFHALLYERIRRDNEALRLYVPLDFQEDFHKSHVP